MSDCPTPAVTNHLLHAAIEYYLDLVKLDEVAPGRAEAHVKHRFGIEAATLRAALSAKSEGKLP